MSTSTPTNHAERPLLVTSEAVRAAISIITTAPGQNRRSIASRMDRHTKRHQAPGDDEFRKHQRSGAFIGEGVERNLITLTRPGLLSDQGPMP